MLYRTQSLVIVPILVLLGLRSSRRLCHDDLINAQDSNGCLRGQSQSPFLGLPVVVDFQLRNRSNDPAVLLLLDDLHALALGVDGGRDQTVEDVDALGIRVVSVCRDHLWDDFVGVKTAILSQYSGEYFESLCKATITILVEPGQFF